MFTGRSMETPQKHVRITVTWKGDGLHVQSNVDNAEAIATLEMAKHLLLQKTVGVGRDLNLGEIAAQIPALQPRKVDLGR